MLSAQELTLPSGLVFPNRLAKVSLKLHLDKTSYSLFQAALAETMAPGSHVPDEKFHIAYGEWAKGGWGMILTGTPFHPA
jgi:hypothetical protein